MVTVLKLDDHDEEREIEFELKFLSSKTIQERFQMMFTKTKEMVDILNKHGYRKPFQIIKRT